VTFILLKLVGLILPLRLPLTQEREGIDRSVHGEAAYHETTGDDLFDLGTASDNLDPATM
jgi:ammonium transporter